MALLFDSAAAALQFTRPRKSVLVAVAFLTQLTECCQHLCNRALWS